MKKKFILLALMCLTLFGGVKWNVLNAQEQWYRIKALRYQGPGNWGSTSNYGFTTDMYLNIDNYDAHVEGPIGGVSVASYSENLDQIFTLEDNGDDTYYIKSASGKYIYCQSWNVDALDSGSPIGIEYIDANTFYMKNTNVSKYFKVEYVSSADGYYPFCDYGNTSYAATWVLEETTIEYTVNVTVSSNEIWSDETVQLSATAINGAGNYSYSWSPATGLDDATSATPIFTPTAAGTYTFTCTATDADGATATSEEITITVKDASEKPLEIVIGTNEGTNTNIPLNSYYYASFSQQIYTSDQIGESSCIINDISFYRTNNIGLSDRNIEIYLLNTDKSQFNSGTDWVELSTNDRVYANSSYTNDDQGWFTFTLDTPFEYTGGNLLVCVHVIKNLKYTNYDGYATFNTDNSRALYRTNDNDVYDISGITQTGTILNKLNHIKFGYEIPAPKPANFVATSTQIYVGETTTLTWDALDGAASYNVYVNGELKGNTEELSYELSGLTYNMNPGHEVEVAAVYENDTESGKASVTVQVTDVFTLTVNVTDGNGNAIESATVTVNTTYAYDEFGEQVASMEPQTTDVEGKVILSLPLLGNSSYYTIIASKSPYAEQSTTVSTAYGIPSSRDLTLYLTSPSNLYPENEEYMLLVGEDLILNWTAAEGAISYNVYKQGEYNNSTWTYKYDLLGSATENTYTTVAEYDGEGSYYAVSAVFEGGLESEKTSTYSRIYVLGTGDVKGSVIDQNGNPVAGAALELSGTTGFGEAETETDGTFYFEDVIEGNYTLIVMHNDYQAVEPLSDITVEYNKTNDLDPITLTAKPEITGVTVTADNNGNVSWTGDYAKYNVYRRNIETSQELETVVSSVTTTSATDAQWETLEPGTYQYGVAALMEQQSSEIVEIINEGFEDNKIPNTWYKYKENIYASSGAEWVTGTRLPHSTIYVNNNCGSYFAYSAGKSYDGNKYHLVTPKINASGCVLSFYYAAPLWGGDKCTLEVLYSSNQEGPWNSLGWSVEGVSSWTYAEIDLSSIEGSFYISFCVTDKWGYGVALDNVSIKGNTLVLDETKIAWSDEVVKQGPATFVGGDTENPTAWDVAANWSTGEVPADGAEVTIAANALISSDVNVKNLTINTGTSLTVANDASLAVTGSITQESTYSIVLEEGGQIFQNNSGVTARFRMSIDKPTEWSNTANKDGWQFISMPMTDVYYTDFASKYNPSTGQYTCDYDLYKYDGSQELEWQNHKDGGFVDYYNQVETYFKSGTGYLASRKEVDTVTVYGTLNTSTSFAGYFPYNAEKDLANFRLIGNPFTYDIKWGDMNPFQLADGFAVVDENGGYDYFTGSDATIKVGQGFFIKAIEGEYPNSQYNYTKTRSAKSESCNSLNIIATGAEGSDNVIINLAGAENEGFNKLQNFNEGIANIFVAKNDIRYGIANFDSDVTMVDVAFEAKEMGNYTIAAQPEGKFESVTLIDRFTGVETNLLIEDYHFTATSRDDYNRFIVKLKVNGQQSIDNSQFAYQSGEDLILNIEGKVQIIDMMGRVVYSNDVTSANNRINVSDFNNAAYLIRVVNEEGVKVQKLIVNSL